MATVYRIRDWEKHFENNRTRDMVKMSWVPVPNKHDGEGLQRIFMEPDGIVIYGCWHLILQVASKCLRERGTLLRDDGTPLTATGIALKTGWKNREQIQRALDFLSDTSVSEVCWIERLEENPAPSCGNPAPSCGDGAGRARAREWNGMEGNRREGKGKKARAEPGKAPASAPAEFQNLPLYASNGPLCRRWPELLPAWRQAYPGVDVMAEVRKAHGWEMANAKRRKVDKARFLNNWLARAQDNTARNTGTPCKQQANLLLQ